MTTITGKVRSPAATEFQVRAAEDGVAVGIEGWASTNRADRMNEIIPAENWELKNFLRNPTLLFAHNARAIPIGSVTAVEPRSRGLYVHADLPGTWDASREAAAAIRGGALRTYSVGFAERSPGKRDQDGTYTFGQCELLEISVVPVPANADCTFTIEAGKLLGIDLVPERRAALSPADHARLGSLKKDIRILELRLKINDLVRTGREREPKRRELDAILAKLTATLASIEARCAE